MAERTPNQPRENARKTGEQLKRPDEQEPLRNFKENTERCAEEIGGYLETGLLQSLPENFRPKYEELLDRHFDQLQETPTSPKCRFTLVLPAYREERVVRQTLESLARQTDVSPEDFEVILVNNYPEGQKPRLNDYDETGRKIGDHEDRTTEIAREFAATSKLRVMVVEQAFPKEVAGVGVASKLGMDLALKRQQESPGIIGYYGTDTVFDERWVKGVLDGFSADSVDGVRGVAKVGQLDNKVEDERGLHVLTPAELAEILELQGQKFEYNMRLRRIENDRRAGAGESTDQLAGLPTLTAGMYAKIGGMKPKTSGEDWGLAQDVADQGHIRWNENMRTTTLARIEQPRVEGGSMTEGLWTMFRAYNYGEGNLLDQDKNLLVEDPARTLMKNQFKDLLQKTLVGLGDEETDRQLLEFFQPDELAQIKGLLAQSQGDWEKFMKNLPPELVAKTEARLDSRFPKIKIAEAEEKLQSL